jgi:hypothetical protein
MVGAGAAHDAKTAALALQVGPCAHQARTLIGQARELDLQAPLSCAGAAGEDLQYQARAVDHLGLPGLFQIALLHRRQGVVDDHDLDVLLGAEGGDVGHLALAEQGGRRGGAQRDDLGPTHLQVERLGEAYSLIEPGGGPAETVVTRRRWMQHQRRLHRRGMIDGA